MVEFVNKVRSTCQRYRLLKPKDKVIVAVSGGADSVSMLLALQELAPEYELQLFVAHLNHLMRGDQAEADANWVKELSAQLGVPFYRRDTDVPALIAEQGLTVEQAGRVARYAFIGIWPNSWMLLKWLSDKLKMTRPKRYCFILFAGRIDRHCWYPPKTAGDIRLGDPPASGSDQKRNRSLQCCLWLVRAMILIM